MVYTTQELADCVRRELKYRRYVYGRKVSEGMMSGEEAAREVGMMQAILEMLESKTQPRLF